jgi:hypothetical protein
VTGHPIPEYTGKYQVGTRVKIVGDERMDSKCIAILLKGPRKGQICGKIRDTPEAMRRHYKKKHPSAPDPIVQLFVFNRDVQREVEEGFTELPLKGTVFDVTPAKWGGRNTPVIVHVHLDIPVEIHSSGKGKRREIYYSRSAMSCLETELKKLVRKT